MAYFIIDKESKEFGFFGSLPVMVEKFGLDKSSLEYHFSRKKETKFENEKYEIFKGELERGGSPKQPLTFQRLGVVALSRNLKLTTTLDRAITQNPCYVP